MLRRLAGFGLAATLSCNLAFGVDELSFGTGGQGGASATTAVTTAQGGGMGGGEASSVTTGATTTVAATGGGGTGGSGGAGAGGGVGGDAIGCSDGTRELLADGNAYPDIAGCSGAWDVPGVQTAESMAPQCGHQAGNDGANRRGNDCSVADLCAAGWHVCLDAADVEQSGLPDCKQIALLANAIFIVREGTSSGNSTCNAPGVNNLFGCGEGVGDVADISCAPLNQVMRSEQCTASPIWECEDTDTSMEALIVVKIDDSEGGVLCCRDR